MDFHTCLNGEAPSVPFVPAAARIFRFKYIFGKRGYFNFGINTRIKVGDRQSEIFYTFAEIRF